MDNAQKKDFFSGKFSLNILVKIVYQYGYILENIVTNDMSWRRSIFTSVYLSQEKVENIFVFFQSIIWIG